MEKTRYSRTKNKFKNYIATNQTYRKYEKGNHNTRKQTTNIIIQTSHNLSPAKLKGGKHTNTTTKKKK